MMMGRVLVYIVCAPFTMHNACGKPRRAVFFSEKTRGDKAAMACSRAVGICFLILTFFKAHAAQQPPQPNVLVTYYSASSIQWTAKLGPCDRSSRGRVP